MSGEIYCPHCEADQLEFWEWIDPEPDDQLATCEKCEKPFLVSVEDYVPTFSAREVTDDWNSPDDEERDNLARFERDLEGHRLTLVSWTEKCETWRLGREGTGCMSTAITFTPWGIVLQGDFTPGSVGNMTMGYGRSWFLGGGFGSDYLAGKFGIKRTDRTGRAAIMAIQRAFAREFARNGKKAVEIHRLDRMK